MNLIQANVLSQIKQKISYTDYAITQGLFFVLWERVSEDSVFTILKQDHLSLRGAYKDNNIKHLEFSFHIIPVNFFYLFEFNKLFLIYST